MIIGIPAIRPVRVPLIDPPEDDDFMEGDDMAKKRTPEQRERIAAGIRAAIARKKTEAGQAAPTPDTKTDRRSLKDKEEEAKKILSKGSQPDPLPVRAADPLDVPTQPC